MRVLFVWITAILVCFILTISWYVSLGICTSFIQQMLSGLTGQAANAVKLLEYVVILWGPLFDALVIVWAILNSQEVSPYLAYQ